MNNPSIFGYHHFSSLPFLCARPSYLPSPAQSHLTGFSAGAKVLALDARSSHQIGNNQNVLSRKTKITPRHRISSTFDEPSHWMEPSDALTPIPKLNWTELNDKWASSPAEPQLASTQISRTASDEDNLKVILLHDNRIRPRKCPYFLCSICVP